MQDLQFGLRIEREDYTVVMDNIKENIDTEDLDAIMTKLQAKEDQKLYVVRYRK